MKHQEMDHLKNSNMICHQVVQQEKVKKLQSNFKHDMISDAVETPGIYENLFSLHI